MLIRKTKTENGRPTKRLHGVVLLAAALLVAVTSSTTPAQAAPEATSRSPQHKNVSEEGYEIIRTHGLSIAMGGHEIGTMVGRDLKTPWGFIFERTQKLVLNRGETKLEIHVETRAEVDKKLRPLRGKFIKIDGSGRQETVTRVEGNTFVVEASQSGTKVIKRHPMAPGLTYFSAFEHEIRENLRAGFEVKRPVFIEEMSGIFPMQAKVKKEGRTFVSEVSMPNLLTIEKYDEQGRLLSSVTPAVNSVAWPLGSALPKGVKSEAADMMAVTTWPVEKLEGDEKAIRYRVWVPEARKFSVPEDSRQRVVNRTDKFIEIVVAGDKATHGGIRKADRTRFLSETQYEAVDDKALKRAANDAVKGAKTTYEKVSKLVAFVFQHVQDHDLDRTYAPAVTTLKDRKGDCTEKSVLLSALLKSQGIPARLVQGVVVSGDVLGYHEWVEAQIDDEGFFPADPTFGEFPASPARLKMVEATSDPAGILLFGLSASRIMRPGVKIEIVETTRSR